MKNSNHRTAPGHAVWMATVLVVGLLLVAAIPTGRAQTPKAPVESAPKSVHLVGHEESALLARIQDALDDWDPRALVSPYLKAIPPKNPATENVRYQIRRPDLLEFIADADMAVALGKAFFWEMQAGSDFNYLGKDKSEGTACASCHYRFGQDARNRHTTRVPYVGWRENPNRGYVLDKSPKDAAYIIDQNGPIDPQKGQFKQLPQVNDFVVPKFRTRPSRPEEFDGDLEWQHKKNDDPLNLSLIVGSQGVVRQRFLGLKQKTTDGVNWYSEDAKSPDSPKPNPSNVEWEMFRVVGGKDHRQITARNSPTVINATFSDRLFHDGRAESTFNGFSIFGDSDEREVIHKRTTDGPLRVIPVKIAISHAALASQAVGPVVNEVEMSYRGRTFPDLAKKLLKSKILAAQSVAPDDSVFRGTSIVGPNGMTYEELIRKAFRPEWWNDEGLPKNSVELELKLMSEEDTKKAKAAGRKIHDSVKRAPELGSLMEANFSLYWGLAIMMYESTLVSNNSPFDQMMRGNAEGVWEAWKKHEKRIGTVKLDLAAYTRPNTTDKPKVPRDEIDEASRLHAKVLEAGKKGLPIDNPKIIATAVFQRGMRVFAKHDCRDCHDGPNFSELFDRTANNRIEEGIHKQLSHTLFPNAQGDAAGVQLLKAREKLVLKLADRLCRTNAKMSKETAKDIARKLFDLLSTVSGDFSALKSKIELVLKSHQINPSTALVEEFIKALTLHELTVRDGLGRRTYFSESERVALAELIVGPVLIERMDIPFLQLFSRRPLPSGGIPSAPHAFYDAGFYALGLTHPRFDRGVGGIHQEEHEEVSPDLPQSPASISKAVQQSASGVSGSAYRKPSTSRGKLVQPPTVKPVAPPQGGVESVTNPAATKVRDTSWSRTQLYPDFTWQELAAQNQPHRRNETEFISRARQLVLNEETWGHRKPFLHDNELAFWGAFKTPTLRNVELTAPYMHNGQLQTLEEVIEFYDDGGIIDRSQKFNPDKHPRIRRQNMTTDDKKALLFFLLCLTDESVRTASGVFDHPGLRIPNGQAAWIKIDPVGRTNTKADSLYPTDQ